MTSVQHWKPGTGEPALQRSTASFMNKLFNILLVDDDEIFIFLTRKMLQLTGRVDSVTVFRSGKEALEYLSENCEGPGTPDVIFLDLNMPEMTGWEFLDEYQRYLQRCQQPPKLYIVSSSTAESDEARAMKTAGVSGYIPKPLHTEGVRSMLQIASLEPGR